jgi:hypothetical protein
MGLGGFKHTLAARAGDVTIQLLQGNRGVRNVVGDVDLTDLPSSALLLAWMPQTASPHPTYEGIQLIHCPPWRQPPQAF